MDRTLAVRPLRLLLVAAAVAVVFVVVIGGLSTVLKPGEIAVLLPFAAATLAVGLLGPVRGVVDRLLRRVAHDTRTSPYSALAETAARIRAGSLEQALPELARVLAEGTGAHRAVLWLAVRDRLVSGAAYPPAADATPVSVDNLAVLLAGPDTDHVVPVLDGSVLRAALAIGKPGRPITPDDQRLMQDVANGAGMLLRGVALNAELAERVRRADELAGQLAASRQRLTQAREVERRRLVGELSGVTADRLSALRSELVNADEWLADDDAEEAQASLRQARTDLDELLERFRVIARGVYPAVLRDHGPLGALDEVIADLPRNVRLSGDLAGRLAWEIESGIYYLAASALRQLGTRAGQPLRVHLEHADGLLSVRIDDPDPPTSAEQIRDGLADDVDRLTALGGDLELTERPGGAVVLRAWLPDQLAPTVARHGGAG